MKILAIETSCDDTGIAILEVHPVKSADKVGGVSAKPKQFNWASNNGDFEVLSNIVSSQTEVHKKYGGVYPMMAKREHQKNLVPVLIKSLKESGLLKTKSTKIKTQELKVILEREPGLYKKLIAFLQKYEKPNVDLIAVTNGPGLEPCLWVGVNFAKALSYFWNIPIIPVNHIESHILVNYLNSEKIDFPAIALVVSGGHTQLILMKKIGSYKILGETRDDAAGECFDKCAKILGLGYPGGLIISKLAAEVKPPRVRGGLTSAKLPRPMINTKDYDFSFSGLKTAVLYKDQKTKTKSQKYKKEMASEIQQAIIDVLLKKTIKAAKDFNAKTIILGGGVSANEELRKQFLQRSNLCKLLVPSANLSTDNALMTAITGYFHKTKKIAWQKLKAEANLRVK